MAEIKVVHYAQSAGAAAHATLTITQPAIGHVLVVGISKSTENTQPTVTDNGAKGSEGWTVETVHAEGSANTKRVSVARKKITEAGVTEIKAASGTIQGLACFELENATTETDVIVASKALAAAKSAKSPELGKETVSGDIIIGFSGSGASNELAEAWTGEGPLVNESTAASRCYGGFKVMAAKIKATSTFTANFKLENASPMIVVIAIKAISGHKEKETLTAELKFVGTLGRTITHAQSAALNLTGMLERKTIHALSAVLSFAGTLGRTTTYALSAALNLAGALGRKIIHAFSGTLEFTGALGRMTTHLLAAGLEFKGALQRTTIHASEAMLTFKGTLRRTTTRLLSGTLKFFGRLQLGREAFQASLSFAGQLPRTTMRAIKAELSSKGALGQVVIHTFTGVLNLAGSLNRTTSALLIASLKFAGVLPRTILHMLQATLSFLGRVSSSTKHMLGAMLNFKGSLSRNATAFLNASLSFSGNLQRKLAILLKAILSFRGVIKRGGGETTVEILRAALSFGKTHMYYTTLRTRLVGVLLRRQPKATITELAPDTLEEDLKPSTVTIKEEDKEVPVTEDLA